MAGASFSGPGRFVGKDNASFSGPGWTVEGNNNTISGPNCKAFGNYNTISGPNCQAFGDHNTLTGPNCGATGDNNNLKGDRCHARGDNNHLAGRGCTEDGENNVIEEEDEVLITGSAVIGNVISGSGSVCCVSDVASRSSSGSASRSSDRGSGAGRRSPVGVRESKIKKSARSNIKVYNPESLSIQWNDGDLMFYINGRGYKAKNTAGLRADAEDGSVTITDVGHEAVQDVFGVQAETTLPWR